MDKYEALHKYFGYDNFRQGQSELIDALIEGKDVLGVMPTGAGKSMCYQIPALVRGGVTLVVSPLISLMNDQVAALKSVGIPSAYINSTLSPSQVDLAVSRALEGRYSLIYIAPERLNTYGMRQIGASGMVSLVAVDEAHCISQWGQDFRPDYLNIHDFIDSLPCRPPVGAFTATATPTVRKDITDNLQLNSPVCVTTSFDRPNLYFDVLKPENRFAALTVILEKHADECGIIYCATRKEVDSVNEKLQSLGFSSARYHAGLNDEERTLSQENFQNGTSRIMVATNAFGMGIDKKNVRFVIHYNMPRSMEAYYQEAGRAGRDGLPAECVLLYNGSDIFTAKYFIEHSEENANLSPQQRSAQKHREYQRLDSMINYCDTIGCFRKSILGYFGERSAGQCCNCGNCKAAAYRQQAISTAKPAMTKKIAMTTVIKVPNKSVGSKTVADTPCATDVSSLISKLRTYRLNKSKELRVLPFQIFSDATMNNIAAAMPVNTEQLLNVSGIGNVKCAQYGNDIIELVNSWLESAPKAPSVMDKIDTEKEEKATEEWTAPECAILRRAYLSGMPIDTIASLHGRTSAAIIEQLKKLGLIL